MQYIPESVTLSLEVVCELVKWIYEELSIHLCQDLDYDYTVDFFLAGRDPKDRTSLKLAWFEAKVDLSSVGTLNCLVKYQVLSQHEEAYAIGDGQSDFRSMLGQDFSSVSCAKKAFGVLDRICKDDSIGSVGGMRQAGFFDAAGDFCLYVVNEQNQLTTEYGDFLARLNLNKIDDPHAGVVVRRRMIAFG